MNQLSPWSDLPDHFDAVIVGSGPNGLTAAATLATAGKRVLVVEGSHGIGGAASTTDHGRPGWAHDVGSTVHALAAISPGHRQLRLEGIEYVDAPVLMSHVLDGGAGASMYRSVEETAEALGRDAARYRRLIGPLVERFDELSGDILGPLISWPSHPLLLLRFGLRALPPMSAVARLFRTAEARAFLGGSAAHSFTPLHHPLTTSFALMLHASGHHAGWPFALGGSQSLSNALAAVVTNSSGSIVTGHHVEDIDELPAHDVLLLDTSPEMAANLLSRQLPKSRQRRYRRFRHGPGAYKIDFELSGAVPWDYEPARSAGTVHVIGDYAELAASERAIARGSLAERPFVLFCQASVADVSRAPAGKHTGWAYAHVPHGFTGDATPAIISQIERFAPGFGDLIESAHVSAPATLESLNPNLVGGDVGGGSYSGIQILRRPVLSPHPYRTGAPGVYLCSASTPPGAGAHGMSGYHAARDALSRELA